MKPRFVRANRKPNFALANMKPCFIRTNRKLHFIGSHHLEIFFNKKKSIGPLIFTPFAGSVLHEFSHFLEAERRKTFGVFLDSLHLTVSVSCQRLGVIT